MLFFMSTVQVGGTLISTAQVLPPSTLVELTQGLIFKKKIIFFLKSIEPRWLARIETTNLDGTLSSWRHSLCENRPSW